MGLREEEGPSYQIRGSREPDPGPQGGRGRTPESEGKKGRNPRGREESGARSTGQRKERPELPGSEGGGGRIPGSPRAGGEARRTVEAARGGARKDPGRPCCATPGISVPSPRCRLILHPQIMISPHTTATPPQPA